jgi:DNA-binding beta-propeller fold protein YncE
MHRKFPALAACLFVSFISAHAQSGPYKVLADTKVGGLGAWDYITADSDGRKLYVPRMGAGDVSRVTVYDLDTLAHISDFPETAGHGVAVLNGHGFVSSKPVVMFDAKSLAPIKSIPVDGRPDGIFADAFNDRVYILSHAVPNLTVIDGHDGTVLGTIDIGGAPEQAASDGAGHLYVDIEDKGAIAIIDTKSMKMTGKIDLAPKADGCAGLAIDAKNSVLFAACREPNVLAVVDIASAKVTSTLPIGVGCDGAFFNPATGEVFATAGDGTLTVVNENSPTSFAVEQTVATAKGARTLTLDSKTGKIFTITAEFGPAPAAQPGQRSRPPMLPDTFQIIAIGK